MCLTNFVIICVFSVKYFPNLVLPFPFVCSRTIGEVKLFASITQHTYLTGYCVKVDR